MNIYWHIVNKKRIKEAVHYYMTQCQKVCVMTQKFSEFLTKCPIVFLIFIENIDEVEKLIQTQDVNGIDDDGNSPLILAAKAGTI